MSSRYSREPNISEDDKAILGGKARTKNLSRGYLRSRPSRTLQIEHMHFPYQGLQSLKTRKHFTSTAKERNPKTVNHGSWA